MEAAKKTRVTHWVIVGHRAIRFVWKKSNDRKLETYVEIPLATIVSCEVSFKQKPVSNKQQTNQKYLVNLKGIRESGDPNFVIIRDSMNQSYSMFTAHVSFDIS